MHPLFLGQFSADAVGGQFFVPPAQDFFVLRAKQHIGDVACAEAFACAFDAGQELLGGDGDIGQFVVGWSAIVAIVAVVSCV